MQIGEQSGRVSNLSNSMSPSPLPVLSTVGDRAEIMLFGDSPETFSFVLGQV